MHAAFQANGHATLIGSLPMDNHQEAARLVWQHTPDIPLWVQLPVYPQEGMMAQFLPGFPGLTEKDGRTYIQSDGPGFEADLLGFYEDYLAAGEGAGDLDSSRFALSPQFAPGFFEMLRQLEAASAKPLAVKAQITGPITLGTGITDQDGRAIFYDERLRDAAVKLLALKARWQVRRLAQYGRPVILFFDEPALTGFGSAAFISISKADIAACFAEVIAAVQAEGGLAGIHVCANAEWSLVLDSPADILSFDAYAYFDRLMLYPEQLRNFLNSGRMIAWGLIPTLNPEDLAKERVDTLAALWEARVAQLTALVGIDPGCIISQSLITPACGTGSLTLAQAVQVLELTAGLSDTIRRRKNINIK